MLSNNYNRHDFVSGILLLYVVFVLHATKAADISAVNPALPRTCYSCEGMSCLRISKLNTTTECLDLLDYCVTAFRGYTVLARGCYSELSPSYREKCDLDNHPECRKCFGNRCNDKGRTDFKCINCNSSNNSDCAANSSALAGIQCPIPTAPNSYCYVRAHADGTTTRGCLVHQREQRECLSDQQCSMCVSDFTEACNTYKVTTRATSGGSKVFIIQNIETVTTIAFMFFAFAVQSI